jgi:prolyl-tRNA synthetase
VRRVDRAKAFVSRAAMVDEVKAALERLQSDLLEKAKQRMADNTREARSLDELTEIISGPRGFVWAGWDGTRESEARVKELTKATIRNIPLEGSEPAPGMKDVVSGAPARHRVLFARAY